MKIRNVSVQDLQTIYQIEVDCFPPNQAASLETLSKRFVVFPQHFWLVEVNGQVVGFINGMITNNDTVNDEMFSNAQLHDERGEWQSVFGLAIMPSFQGRGYAGELLRHVCHVSNLGKRKGVVLTCEDHLIAYYEKFGFINIGLSASVHGGDVFYDMKKEF